MHRFWIIVSFLNINIYLFFLKNILTSENKQVIVWLKRNASSRCAQLISEAKSLVTAVTRVTSRVTPHRLMSWSRKDLSTNRTKWTLSSPNPAHPAHLKTPSPVNSASAISRPMNERRKPRNADRRMRNITMAAKERLGNITISFHTCLITVKKK